MLSQHRRDFRESDDANVSSRRVQSEDNVWLMLCMSRNCHRFVIHRENSSISR